MRLLYFASLVVIILKDVARTQDPLCDSGEYRIDGVCCPMCDSGNRVQRPCTVTTSGSTSCIPCMAGTYMDHPSGLTECFKCKSCDPGSGLRVKSNCTYTRNTVCACMDGYYCLTPASEDCDLCERHTVCNTGEKVKVYGTERTNTVCEKCPQGTFSNQTMSNSCVTWTSCRDLNRAEKKRGTHSSDSVCDENIRTRIGLIVSVALSLALSMTAFIITRINCGEYRKEREEKDCKTVTAEEPPIQRNCQLPVQETQDPCHAEMGAELAIDRTTTITLELPQCTINSDQVLPTNLVSAGEGRMQHWWGKRVTTRTAGEKTRGGSQATHTDQREASK